MVDPEDDLEEAQRRRALELFATVKESVQAVLSGPQGEAFMEWLALVGYGNRSTFNANERVHCFREGKRALFLEITRFRDMTTQQLLELRERKIVR